MSELITIDEFRARARTDAKFVGSVQRLATGAATEVDATSRTLRFCFSDGSVDRAGDSIEVDGWDLTSFQKNPVALWAHDSSSPPIGRAANVGVVGKRLMGDIEFAPVETYAFADTIYRLCKDGYINAVSVGFMPRDWQFSADKERPFGIDFLKQELLEITVCPVPCNANALAEARAKGIDTGPLRSWAEKILDGGESMLIPRSVLEDIFKDARTPHSARAKYRALIETHSPEEKIMPKAIGENGNGSNIVGASANCGREKEMECGMKDAAECAIHAPKGDCGRGAEEACGMSDPMECDTHYTGAKALKIVKAGRRISQENKALLEKAISHHEEASKCIKDVLDSNEPDEPAKPEPTAAQGEGLEMLDPEPKTAEERVAQTKKLLASIKL